MPIYKRPIGSVYLRPPLRYGVVVVDREDVAFLAVFSPKISFLPRTFLI
jgi:hypothetical protein